MSEWADSLEAMETTMGTKTTTVYNQDMQNSISERTTHPSLIYSLATLLGTSVPRKVAVEVVYLLYLSFSH